MLAIIVPYRDRVEHFNQFVPHITQYLPNAKVIIVEQADDKPFNRGKLLNIGYLETKADTYCFHDIDMLPVNVNYSEAKGVTQLAYSSIQTKGYLGGVTMFDKHTFSFVGGYHNDFFHRAEDNEMMFRLKEMEIGFWNRFGSFKKLPHPRTGLEFIPELWEKAQISRSIDMLKTCKYQLKDNLLYDWGHVLKVSL